MTSWRELIQQEMILEDESWEDVEHCTLQNGELDRDFDSSYGQPEGTPFTLWTRNRVYFPLNYDGEESVGSVPRNPCNEATEHLGGCG